MFVLANLLNAFAQILHYVLNIYMWIIIIRTLLTWVNPDPYNPIVRFLYQVTEPVLYQVRKRLPYIGGIDISPIIVIFIIWFLQGFLVQTISDIALRMRIGG
ncbi:MAG: YggT family protein [Deltaproteobacteria bacterium]|nr:YggT family protein [Deltaproteobacteria bacterium]